MTHYVVVLWEAGCESVPCSWIDFETNTIRWPPERLNATAEARKASKPEDEWSRVKYKKLVEPYATYDDARRAEMRFIDKWVKEASGDLADFLEQPPPAKQAKVEVAVATEAGAKITGQPQLQKLQPVRSLDPGYSVQQSENTDMNELITGMARLEKMVLQQNNLLETVLKRQNQILAMGQQQQQQQQQQQRQGILVKPARLPITSIKAMDEFEGIDDREFQEIVKYFADLGGLTLREAINLCFKEAFVDEVLTSYTWRGRGGKSFCDRRILRAIDAAVLRSRQFQRPTRSEVGELLEGALGASKQRVRRKERDKEANNRGIQNFDYWSDTDDEVQFIE